jgi:hypothetical protein
VYFFKFFCMSIDIIFDLHRKENFLMEGFSLNDRKNKSLNISLVFSIRILSGMEGSVICKSKVRCEKIEKRKEK